MEFNDISEAALYMVWLENNKNITETEDIKSAFHAEFHLAFKRMMYLMEIVTILTASDSGTPKN